MFFVLRLALYILLYGHELILDRAVLPFGTSAYNARTAVRHSLIPNRHIVGITLRLCIELDCHRSVSRANVSATPFMKELRKRLFWCTYCFDRCGKHVSPDEDGLHIKG